MGPAHIKAKANLLANINIRHLSRRKTEQCFIFIDKLNDCLCAKTFNKRYLTLNWAFGVKLHMLRTHAKAGGLPFAFFT